MPKGRKPIESWEALAKSYLNRDCTQSEFCSRHNVNASSLQYHVARLRKQDSSSFLPMELRSEAIEREITLDFPSGLRLCIRG